MNFIQVTGFATFLLLSVPLHGEEKQNGTENLDQFSQAIESAFKTHDPDKLRKLHHPSSPKKIVDTKLKVIRGAIDLPFDTREPAKIDLKAVPLELPAALPNGQQVKFQSEPDGVVKLTVRGGRNDSKIEFVFYFAYKTIDSRVFLCPLDFK